MNDEFEAEAGLGIFAGDAIRVHDTATTKMDPDRKGIVIKAACIYCGRDNELHVDWQELAIISAGAPPRGWVYDQSEGMIRPDLGCPSCKRAISVGLTPDECTKHLRTAVSSKVVDGAQVDSIRAQVQAQMQQRR